MQILWRAAEDADEQIIAFEWGEIASDGHGRGGAWPSASICRRGEEARWCTISRLILNYNALNAMKRVLSLSFKMRVKRVEEDGRQITEQLRTATNEQTSNPVNRYCLNECEG
ncbi:unnamed protein product [Ranitomeya imitator]|uniref:Uncharacterized protein n=1 Tax=Ranitomeya imitator TaxID=111125 RepID=A0ABN9KXW6_9NEOB|nr:unnamed protein product [Ranitomeya imitator]